jgi:5-dehydro-2-deoxygluconokinase
MGLGYDQQLYILPFDHRATFVKQLFGFPENPTPEQAARVAASKHVVYEGFKAALEMGLNKNGSGILVDEQYGYAILHEATASGVCTAVCVEKSGQEEFDFEYGKDFRAHIEKYRPAFAKVLVRYNPDGKRDMNERQAARLKELSDYLNGTPYKFMFELLVPPLTKPTSPAEQEKYDRDVRPKLMVRAMHELQDAGVDPDVWKIEGVDTRADCEAIVAATRRGGRDKVGSIVLGRGAGEAKVKEWLEVAASVPGYIGFAIGRTSFWDCLTAWRDNKMSVPDAAKKIAENYMAWVAIFEKAKQS